MSSMKWLCYGAGAIGTYVGGSLALAGDEVVFLERASTAAELRRTGLHIDFAAYSEPGRSGRAAVRPASVKIEDSVEEALAHGPFDAAIYALKSFDTTDAIERMRPFAPDLPPTCCFSNGVDNEPALVALQGPGRVITGTVTTAIGRRGPGDVVLERLRGIGLGASHPLAGTVAQALNGASLHARLIANPVAMKWSKLLTNLLANASSAILDMTPADVLRNRDLYRLEVAMLRECLAVMGAQHVPVIDLPGVPVRALALAVRLPLFLSKSLVSRAAGSGRGGKMPSFHIDLHSGRGQTEVDYLNGAVVRAGEQHGVATPVNAVLTELLDSLALGSTDMAEYARQPSRLLATLQIARSG
jgi:2-dehydropantoate 2-reductase